MITTEGLIWNCFKWSHFKCMVSTNVLHT